MVSRAMRTFASHVGAIAHKELLHTLRDRQLLTMALGMPLLLILLFGYAISFDVEQAPVALLDQDRSAASRRLARSFDASDAMALRTPPCRRVAEVERLLRRGEVKAALVIPRGFGRALARGEAANLQLLLDGVDGTTTRALLGSAVALAQRESRRLAGPDPHGQLSAPLTLRLRLLFNPAMRSALFIVPGLLAVVLGVIAVLLTTITVAREWERGSMEQLFATPVGRLPVLLGKLLPYLVLGLLQLMMILVAGAWLFDVPIEGSFALLLLAATLFLACVLGQGLLISTVTRSQQVATQVGAISGILPALLLSGFLFPIDNMPTVLQQLSRIVPARYMVSAMRGVMLSGRGASQLWPELLGLTTLAVALLGLAVWRFRRRLD